MKPKLVLRAGEDTSGKSKLKLEYQIVPERVTGTPVRGPKGWTTMSMLK